ncbi:helix-turn-helix transcriptional regulator [Microbacterium ulmi]|uniref:Helix-turn-helix transcriptional regulator n=1 Tax=Microbacterium ulmi TaxID=179095 RepID=A0A7Y2PXT4_9MICO|nr:AraC family transcriptional regulator [Microbacterium ulmi]NII71302.1 AraC-like DNA-binding protein [Microbacterium ulmi]NNH02606.1 helix-turn-helix transcriptional regulator [Microbacterium ulmi]
MRDGEDAAARGHLGVEVGYCAYRTCPADWSMPRERIDFIDLTYVVSGRAEYTVDGVRHEVSAGDLVCIQPGSVRSASTPLDDPMTCMAIDFVLRAEEGSRLPLATVTRVGIDEELIGLQRELWHTWVHRADRDLPRIDGLVLLILHRCAALADPGASRRWRDPRVDRAVRYITDHFAEPVTVAAIAERAGLHPVYFADLFRQETGRSPRQYLTDVRLRNAVDMLRSGKFRVRDVARACGYRDEGYFSRHVREVTGHPPSAFLRAPSAPWPPGGADAADA